jgi:hypothetical protein
VQQRDFQRFSGGFSRGKEVTGSETLIRDSLEYGHNEGIGLDLINRFGFD